ncbi:MAG: hypothetical protein HKP09_08540 [Enterobacterales bacterium]|nr:hypothetical protein [Enterobacterales bacterium]
MSDSFFNELKRRNVFKVGFGYIVLGWLVIQVADVVVPALSLPDWTITMLLVVGLCGFPFALFFAWAYELTPDGIKLENEIDREASIVNETGHKINYAIIGLLCVALSYFVYDKVTRVDSPQVPQETTVTDTSNEAGIAVLPFVNMSKDPDQEFFSDGITEELLNVLAKVPAIQVASRTSSFQFKGQEIGIPEIAKKLDVRYVVEGSVRKAGDTLRITAQLIDSTNDRHLWSEAYDRPLNVDNIFQIQDEISNAIVTALSNELGFAETKVEVVASNTDNLSAYELYLKANSILRSRTRLDEVEELLAKALALDPNYADAWGLRAANTSLLGEYLFSDLSASELITVAREHAEKALSLDPEQGTALALFGKLMYDQMNYLDIAPDWHQMIQYYERSLAVEPNNPQTLNWIALAYHSLGFMDKAMTLYNRCIKVEPRHQPCLVNRMGVHAVMGNDDLAIQEYIAGMAAGAIISRYGPFTSLIRKDEKLAFLLITNDSKMLYGWDGQLDLMNALQNPEQNHSELVADLTRFLKEHPGRDQLTISYYIYLLNGKQVQLDYITLWDPMMSQIRNKSGFKSRFIESNMLAYWRAHGFPPQCQELGNGDFKCN